ncbi:acyl-CoA synthetase [Phaeovibrio sulfidiphilus]|uniref:3-methylmercaptopropionyl-CoA ligase n=1 Tax=Phaeovibrio sulfidiphilus TaxID=1220600 RepID=A0A8J6YKI4_9PROT|nr:acyl-CoA synthetase [Phaeovibrio sulfidiphilus]MBE1236250.1 acyl-CoA synthetase [Phaeovibrio sulfidiphilus]
MRETSPSIYDMGLDKNPANHVPLTPLSHIERTAFVFPDQPSVVHGGRSWVWRETLQRCRRLASALRKLGVGKNDTVSVVLNNTPEMYECHFGVPGAGAVLNTINTRLDAQTVAFILEHAEARVLITDREYAPVVSEALKLLHRPSLIVIDVDDPEYTGPGERLGRMDYEALLATGDPSEPFTLPGDEWDAISLSYTSGTTGNPKGVVYHHRGAFLGALGHNVSWGMPTHSVYLWTLPMFHCNGWVFPWVMAANAGLNVCLRQIAADAIWERIRTHRVTHYCGAPIVHKLIAEAPASLREGVTHTVKALCGGAPPPQTVLEAMEKIGFDLIQGYGLTETYGASMMSPKKPGYDDLPMVDKVMLAGRQGVPSHVLEDAAVLDPLTLEPCPLDGESMGEVMMRGNFVMKGYLKNPQATRDAFEGGWFHSGDLAVAMPDGYVKIRDRSKDIIISGGENISSIEVENAIYAHPAVNIVAVVAAPDEKWGETPAAFIELRPGMEATEEDIIRHCRDHLAGFKIPRRIIFDEIPRTSTGKIQKYMLRDRVGSLASFE